MLAGLPALAAVIAEAGWLAVVAAALSLGSGRPSPEPGLALLAAGAGAGLLFARRTPVGRRRLIVLPLVVGAGALGWLLDDGARGLLLSGGVRDAATINPAGWLLGVAAWRGTRHANPADDDLVVGSLLAWAVPVLAVPWIVGMQRPESRGAFVDAALPATLAFVASGLVAMGLTRLDALSRSSGVDWHTNRAWIALLLGVVGAVLAIGLPIALILGASIAGMAASVLGPVGAVGGTIGALLGHGAALVWSLLAGFVAPGAAPSSLPSGGTLGSPAEPPSFDVPGWAWTGLALGIGVLVLYGVAMLHRRTRGAPRPIEWRPPPREDRRFVRPCVSFHLPRLALPRLAFGSARTPTTASEAYVGFLGEVEIDAELGRLPAESPAAHARRLRTIGLGGIRIDLLAADYQLERYAGLSLTRSEERRAIRRWSRLRRPRRRTLIRPSARDEDHR